MEMSRMDYLKFCTFAEFSVKQTANLSETR